MGNPFISIVVCTRNRRDHVGDMLQTLVEMKKPDGLNWELVIVDNGSTDDTFKVINGYADRLPLVAVKEPQAGLSFARNKGVETAKGQYIIWTDDDVRVDKAWLTAYAQAFEKYPEAAYFGGPIEPVFHGKIPSWLSENMDIVGSAFAKRDLGGQLRKFEVKPGDIPYGANFAIRAKEQKRTPYATYLGVSPHFRRLGEETSVMHAIRDSGGQGYWIPKAKVLHIIPEKRQSLDYILEYRRCAGETWAVLCEKGLNKNVGPDIAEGGRRFMGGPVWIWRKTFTSWLSYRFSKISGKSETWLRKLMTYGYYRGALDYLVRTRKLS